MVNSIEDRNNSSLILVNTDSSSSKKVLTSKFELDPRNDEESSPTFGNGRDDEQLRTVKSTKEETIFKQVQMIQPKQIVITRKNSGQIHGVCPLKGKKKKSLNIATHKRTKSDIVPITKTVLTSECSITEPVTKPIFYTEQ